MKEAEAAGFNGRGKLRMLMSGLTKQVWRMDGSHKIQRTSCFRISADKVRDFVGRIPTCIPYFI